MDGPQWWCVRLREKRQEHAVLQGLSLAALHLTFQQPRRPPGAPRPLAGIWFSSSDHSGNLASRWAGLASLDQGLELDLSFCLTGDPVTEQLGGQGCHPQGGPHQAEGLSHQEEASHPHQIDRLLEIYGVRTLSNVFYFPILNKQLCMCLIGKLGNTG